MKLEKLEVEEIIDLMSNMNSTDKEKLEQLFVMVADKLVDKGEKDGK